MYQTPLDKAIGHFIVDHGGTQQQFADMLGISDTAWRKKRMGKSRFYADECYLLAQALGKTMEEVYRLLPESQR